MSSLPSSLEVRTPALGLEVNPHPQAHPGSCPSGPVTPRAWTWLPCVPEHASIGPLCLHRPSAASQQDPLSLLQHGTPSHPPGPPASGLSLSRPPGRCAERVSIPGQAELSPAATSPAQVCPLALTSPHTGGFRAQRVLLRDAPDCLPG